MIVISDKNNINEITEFAWSIQSNIKTASYPMYKSKDEIKLTVEKAIGHLDDMVLMFIENNTITGILILIVEKKDLCLQACGVYVDENHSYAYNEFIVWLKNNFHGYKMIFGFPYDNKSAQSAVTECHAECIELCVTMLLKSDDFIYSESKYIPLVVTEENFEDFASFHDRMNPEMQWTSENIKAKLDIWKIYIIKISDKTIGSILTGIWYKPQFEIYSLSVESYNDCTDTDEIMYSLLTHSMKEVFALEKSQVLYMIDEKSSDEIANAEKVGFRKTGDYKAFKLKLV